MNLKNLISFYFIVFALSNSYASVLGGSITWECLGTGQHQFKLIIYRNCNENDITNSSFQIKVWNHPSLQNIPVNFLERKDISPNCTEVLNGPSEISCEQENQGTTVLGAIEELIYISSPIVLSGVPPNNGWVFTWENNTRSLISTNFNTPGNYGITINSTIFPYQNQNTSTCYDSSPKIEKNPIFVGCAKTQFEFNSNAFDPNNDSISIEFDRPLDKMNNNLGFNQGTNPTYIPFNNGYIFNSPTPNNQMNQNNIESVLNLENGLIKFTSFNVGNFGTKIKISSFRNGIKISEVTNEYHNIIIDCENQNNNAPKIIAPFNGNTSFEKDYFAGETINFDLLSEDMELLQDGKKQLNRIEFSGEIFGSNFNVENSGCNKPPCATLNKIIPYTDTQGVKTNFNWQTTCNHIEDYNGNLLNQKSYYFTFKVIDNYCSVPKVSYATVKINLKNSNDLIPTSISCIEVLENNNAIIKWDNSVFNSGVFKSLEVHSIQDGLLTTITDPSISSYTHINSGTNNNSKDYFLVTNSGCNGETKSHSDTVSSIFVELNNPNNGTVVVQWNQPNETPIQNLNPYFYIYREYPIGNWILRDSVPYNTIAFIDTIDVCEAFINYQIRLKNTTTSCFFGSNTVGSDLIDKIAPNTTDITSISYDTVSNKIKIEWNKCTSKDTYGYFLFIMNNDGFPEIVDTVFGINNTSYIHNINPNNSSLSYTISTFDSCFTTTEPKTYQTSAKSSIQKSNFLEIKHDICSKKIMLKWNGYNTWKEGTANYQILHSIDGSHYQQSTLIKPFEQEYEINVLDKKNYCFIVKSIANEGYSALSNKVCKLISNSTGPDFVYIQSASINRDESITITVHTDTTSQASKYIIERKEEGSNAFYQVKTIFENSTPLIYEDKTAYSFDKHYWYRVISFDSCGNESKSSQIVKTMLLKVTSNEIQMKNFISWSLYEGYDGNIVQYKIYRSIGGVWESNPIVSLSPQNKFYEDDVSAFAEQEGEFCYRVEAIEETNSFNIKGKTFSSVSCANYTPILFVPNAFIIGGINNVFLPVISLHDFSEYSLKIYDRWGRKQFESNNHKEGWNGKTITKTIASEGVYIYLIEFKDTGGNQFSKRGHLTLLKDN